MTCAESSLEGVRLFQHNGLPAGQLARGMRAASESAQERISVLFALPEVFLLAKTGGLADMSAALPATFSELGVDVRVVMPGYVETLDLPEGKQKAAPVDDSGGLAKPP